MGSLSGSGIPVVGKNNHTFRKRDILITSAESTDDTVTTIVDSPVIRTITSGSIVRDDGVTGTVDYYEDLVWGVTRMGRTCLERVASCSSCARTGVVDLAGNETQAVIPTSLEPHTPQISMRHLGDTIQHGQAVGDTIVERIPNSGVYDEGFPL